MGLVRTHTIWCSHSEIHRWEQSSDYPSKLPHRSYHGNQPWVNSKFSVPVLCYKPCVRFWISHWTSYNLLHSSEKWEICIGLILKVFHLPIGGWALCSWFKICIKCVCVCVYMWVCMHIHVYACTFTLGHAHALNICAYTVIVRNGSGRKNFGASSQDLFTTSKQIYTFWNVFWY